MVLLERRGHNRGWAAVFCLGTASPRKKLEPGSHVEGRARTYYQRPLRIGSASDLYRATAGISRFGSGAWRMAGTGCCSAGFRGAMAQAKARGEMDGGAV